MASAHVLASTGASIRAWGLSDGAERWKHDLKSGMATSLTSAGRLLVAGVEDRVSRWWWTASHSSLLALDLETGREVWHVPLEVTPQEITALGDRVYVTTDKGLLCFFHLTQGTLAKTYNARVPAIGRPALLGRTVFFAFADNLLRGFDVDSGALKRWDYPPGRPFAGPSVAAGRLAIPMKFTADYVLVTLESSRPLLRVSPPAPALLESAAVSSDGLTLATLAVTSSGRSVTVYRAR